MAKRKASRSSGRKTAAKRASGGSRKGARKAARKSARPGAARKGAARKASKKRAGASAKRPKSRAKPASAKASARKIVAKKASGRKASAPRTAAKRPPRRSAPQVARKAPALDRVRRTVQDEDIVATPPSSLDLDRTASAARSGRRELSEKFREHTETSPALTGGDIDADWESAYSVGDEAPGGDNPTPDQDIVDDIGKAIGVVYEDNEELKGEKKISDRDKRRWELDPASSDDYDER